MNVLQKLNDSRAEIVIRSAGQPQGHQGRRTSPATWSLGKLRLNPSPITSLRDGYPTENACIWTPIGHRANLHHPLTTDHDLHMSTVIGSRAGWFEEGGVVFKSSAEGQQMNDQHDQGIDNIQGDFLSQAVTLSGDNNMVMIPYI
ncbi:hypothetical protein J6590_066058 [Homalodisca vitripennis]|nr:hypothetical protein J6590_066058 [Homalodisca vitripennis]